MRLSRLLERAGVVARSANDPEISRASLDSRTAGEGCLFCAVRGSVRDGNDWAEQALAAGAAAVLTDRRDLAHLPGRVLVDSVPDAVGPVCRVLAGEPDRDLLVLAVTGTNGKTSSCYLAEAVFREAGLAPALSSTVVQRHPGGEASSSMTTPDAVALWGFIAEAAAAGAKSLVLEVSSHALHQGRLGGIHAQAAIFTNLSRDHLDYHHGMEEYFEAKALLFSGHLAPDGIAVVNVDDPWGRILATRLGSRCRGVSLQDPAADWRILDLVVDLDGNRFRLASRHGDLELESPLVGEVFARNLAGVAAAAVELGLEPEAVRRAAKTTRVPGRCQVVRAGSFRGAVDYAHTPDALERLLAGLRPLVSGRLVCVFGCGGDRDKGKRPLMGAIAARAADLAVATSDNPRTEDPESILDDVCAGIPGGSRSIRIADRGEAIAKAASLLEPGDFLVVAGKGHEDYQIVGTRKRHFDDVQELTAALAAREGASCRP
jgi:UDP-N-acetylmuramoyl-L-alanyl-D-glutamate--2,6-diaminopimelate ligase